jgi:hypothetical protein
VLSLSRPVSVFARNRVTGRQGRTSFIDPIRGPLALRPYANRRSRFAGIRAATLRCRNPARPAAPPVLSRNLHCLILLCLFAASAASSLDDVVSDNFPYHRPYIATNGGHYILHATHISVSSGSPPNYRLAGPESPSCYLCAHLRYHKAGRLACLKHLAYVALWKICDDWELGKESLAKFGLERRELNEEERMLLDSVLVDGLEPLSGSVKR